LEVFTITKITKLFRVKTDKEKLPFQLVAFFGSELESGVYERNIDRSYRIVQRTLDRYAAIFEEA
jgi:hypothetical protein